MLPALRYQNARSFDHLFSGIFNTPSYFQHLFLLGFYCVPAFSCVENSARIYIVFQRGMRAFPLSRTPAGARIPIVFQHGACPQRCRIPALPACISTVWNRLLCARSCSILSCLPRKSANTSTVFSIFSHALLLCSSTGCVHFHSVFWADRAALMLLWSSLELSGALWSFLELSGAVWCSLEMSGALSIVYKLLCGFHLCF